MLVFVAVTLFGAEGRAAAWSQSQELLVGSNVVALSGSLMAVGSATGGPNNAGVVRIYAQSNGTWTQQAQLIAGDSTSGDGFGAALALSGGTLVVGASPGYGQQHGAVYLFTQAGTTWTQTQKLQNVDASSYDGFGYAVSISGTSLLVGAPCMRGTQEGAAYVFSPSSGVYVQQARLTRVSPQLGDNFGGSVFLVGTTAVVGAPGVTLTSAIPYTGAVSVFTGAVGSWQQVQDLAASDGASGDRFGSAIALSGSTLVIGAQNRSAAYVFGMSGTTWTFTQSLSGVSNSGLGTTVAFDGTTMMVGAPYETVGANAGQGAVHVYALASGSWNQQQLLTAADGASWAMFGAAVAVSGSTAIIGQGFYSGSGSYIFTGPAAAVPLPALGSFAPLLALLLLAAGVRAMRARRSAVSNSPDMQGRSIDSGKDV